ncbi:MAG: hypothetical protein SNG38_07900 [Rikenellaceae bacterium]
MRKYFLLLGAALISMASCVKDDQVASSEGKFTAQLEIETGSSMATRADEARYVVEAYYDSEYSTPASIFEGEQSSIETTAGSVSINLDPDAAYYFLVWADDGISYDASDLQNVTLTADAIAEAWHATYSIVNSSATVHTVSLVRAVAKVNFIETAEFCSPTFDVAYAAYTAFNTASGDVVGDKSSFTLSYTYSDSVTGALNDEPIYVLAPVASADVIDFDFTDVIESFSVTNVPVQANYVTNINGHYTGLITSSLTIDQDEVWDLDPVEANIVKFNDSAFEAAVLTALGKIEGQTVTVDEALTLTSLTLENKGITDMTGINYFTNLTTLQLNKNYELTYLDVSKLNKLVTFKCHDCTLLETIIEPEDPSSIQVYYTHATARTTLDISKMTSLKTLYAYRLYYLTSIDFRKCPNLSNTHLDDDYDLEYVYLNDGQAASGTWSFANIVDTKIVITYEDGDVIYDYGFTDPATNIEWVY